MEGVPGCLGSQQGAQTPWPQQGARASDEHLAGVQNLRARLLEEARRQREHRLRYPEGPTREPGPLRGGPRDAAAQTEPEAAAPPPPPDRGAACAGWSPADEERQAEAIRTIRRLSERGGGRPQEAEEAAARGVVLGRHLEEERRLSAGAREQVKCLELELDSKESAIRVLEKTLESRDQELHLTQLQVRRLLWREMERERDAQPPPGSDPTDYSRIRTLREQVLELEYQLHLKDLEISRLSTGAPRRPPADKVVAAAADEVSTLCDSERSVALRSGSSAAASCTWGS